jgi:ferredoxin-fold anticodon binding domain-containing protein
MDALDGLDKAEASLKSPKSSETTSSRRFMIMRKISCSFILAALSLCFFDSVVSSAYAHSLVFGPEIFSGESGKYRRVVKHFSVHDADQKFFISVQSGKDSEKGAARSTISINGKPVFSRDEIGKPFQMLTKPVILKKQNDISVEMNDESVSPIIVTIMSLEAQMVTKKISPLGGRVNLEEYALVTFPANAFEDTRDVTMSVSASPSVQDIFEVNAPGPRLPYEIRINTGNKAPATPFSIGVKFPDAFFTSNYQMHICARMYDNPDEPDVHDRFCVINSGVSHMGVVFTSLPQQVFSSHYGKNGTYEAIITVVLVQ